ncbi:DoxX protein [Bernardetia litoralis DSM 6794]|uniref:DoxX protein n=1 Tax=Bernardetia litoralis (strain ATCC 23117 / DSM 6794 / NBRC 15988 / NCIMB 1366 / Fx l1 / Sio-4) TaxID=880071 RepID=I4AGY9_BERLS|nr:DoxX family membrane protein [Bernardetia litoralis]AFM03224.1 DoxX protein [Bernardetia litoralis DSM 6794]
MLLDIFSFFTNPIEVKLFLQVICSFFLAVLFIQSGFNKVFRWNENWSWLIDYFKGTYLEKPTTPLLVIITIFEVAAGVFSAIGVITLLLTGDIKFAYIGSVLAALNIAMLFFGQRVVKNYDGAADLVGYFILCVISVYILGGLS